MADEKRSHEPHDRLTRLCAEMTAVLDAKGEEVADVKCVVFLQDGDRGGLQMYGYEKDSEALADLFIHLKAIFAANGTALHLGALTKGPVGQG